MVCGLNIVKVHVKKKKQVEGRKVVGMYAGMAWGLFPN